MKINYNTELRDFDGNLIRIAYMYTSPDGTPMVLLGWAAGYFTAEPVELVELWITNGVITAAPAPKISDAFLEWITSRANKERGCAPTTKHSRTHTNTNAQNTYAEVWINYKQKGDGCQ